MTTDTDGVTGCLTQQFEARKILLEELSFLFPISNILVWKLYVPVTVHREQSVKKEYQQDATI